jgi:hypothetical protein
MSVYNYFPGDTLLVISIVAFFLGSTLLAAAFLGLGARRQDPALASIMKQVADTPAAPLRETYIADIVDGPAAPAAQRALTR